MEINCKDFQDRIRNVDIGITAHDGSKIINTVDLVNIFDRGEIKYTLLRKGKDLKTGKDGTANYHVKLRAESR